MRRVYVLCEGLTEAAFADQVLRPRLPSETLLVPIDQKGRGGITYPRLKRDIQSLLGGEAVVTTMLDLYALPENYPRHQESQAYRNPLERARVIERAIEEDIGSRRFVPYLQVYEFEALWFAEGLARLKRDLPHRGEAIDTLLNSIHYFQTPEHINDQAPPKSRITAAVPEYRRASFRNFEGFPLDQARERCLHFDAWLAKLEETLGLRKQSIT
ncbi:MAG: DUF4276 family protein [Acidobacteria bacterium]|nr:DUF4276 family protein [Acidobacteriota bacterium]